MKKKDVGVVLYAIEKDGCLNGVYTNTPASGEIFNEIDKKTGSLKNWPTDITGKYYCAWIEAGSPFETGELEISPTSVTNEYKFVWKDTPTHICFVGKGYKMNDHQIVVHYSVSDPTSKHYAP